MQPKPLRLAVFLSGSGTTLQNLIDCIATSSLAAEIALVVSNKAGVLGLEKAKLAGIPTAVVMRKDYANLEAFSERFFDLAAEAEVDLVCLAGFLAKLKIPSDFAGHVLNIHPSLLPRHGGKGMYGIHVHEAVLKAGDKFTGCTVHLVDDEYDHGQIVHQRRIPVTFNDTPESLAKRVFAEECLAYPEAIRMWAAKFQEST
jgi:phosphoribosylglycinamide formyltransferase 1